MRHLRFAPLAIVAALLYSAVGMTYVINNWWNDGDNIVMDDVFLPAATWSSPAQFQMSEFNEIDVTDNSHPFRINNNPQFSFGANDGDNTIGFLGEAGLNSEYGLSYASALAWTACWTGFLSSRYDECDVMLDPTLGWTLGPNNSTWFQSTVLHELGHVRGLGHYNNFQSMQNSGQSKYLRNEVLYMDDKVGVRQHASNVSERDVVIYNKWHNGSTPQWMSMSPLTLREGQVINMNNITIENRGTIALGTLRFGVYLSTNSTISTGDTLLNTGSFGSFGTFTFSTFNWSATIPTVNDCGTRYIGGIVDDNGAYAERFEGNNATVFTNGVPFSGQTFVPTPLNILLREDTLEPNDSQGAARTISLPFSNSSLSIDTDNEQDWYRFTVSGNGQVVINVNFTHSLGNINLDLRNSSGTVLQSSTSTTNNESITRTLTAGTYYARVYGSGGGSCNKYSMNVTFNQPDLTMTVLNAPVNAVPGQTISVANTVRNAGQLTASNFRVGFYLSTNSICSTGDTFMSSRAVASVAPGATHSVTSAMTIPAGTTLGTRWVCAIADDLNVISETNESNNTLADQIEIIGKPDLDITAVSGTTPVLPGGSTTVMTTVENIGLANAGTFRVGIYLSDDTRCVVGDLFLGFRTVSSLAQGGTSTASTVVTIPSSVTPGAKTLCAIADYTGLIDESVESNNDMGVPFAISAPPTVNLKINGQDPANFVVSTPGPVRLTLDMATNGYTGPLDWYWAIYLPDGTLAWITSSGVSTTPAPLFNAPPFPATDLPLIDATLPAGVYVFYFFGLDPGGNLAGFDYIVAAVTGGPETD